MARRPPKGDTGDEREILRRITAKLSRVPKPDVEKALLELKQGFHEFAEGESKGKKQPLSAGKTIERVARLLRSGVAAEQIPSEVATRFDWSVVLNDVEEYAQRRGVDPNELMRALSVKTRRRPHTKSSGTFARAPELDQVAKELGVSPKRLAGALKKTAKRR